MTMNDDKRHQEDTKKKCAKPGIQDGKYEGAGAEAVKQEVKELNNIGAPGKQY